MLAAALPLIVVPLAWYALGVIGAVLHLRRDSGLTALAAARGAGLVILVTWMATRWLALPGWGALVILGLAVAAALGARVARGAWRAALTPARRDLPVLGLGTALMSVWMAPITRHGVGAIGTGNHADLPSYLLQAVYLLRHGFATTSILPGIHPEDRMFDAFGATALLAPSTAVAAVPSAGVMVVMAVGAVLVAQLTDRLASRALGGTRLAPAALAMALLLSWAFTFNTFAYFLAQVWGIALGLALLTVVLGGEERGVAAAVSAGALSVAGALTYNPTGAMYAGVALLLGAWLALVARFGRRTLPGAPALASTAGTGAAAIVFLPVWQDALERLWNLRDAVAGWPMPTAPLWAAVGIPIAELGNSTPAIVAGSLAVAAVAGAGWLTTASGRRAYLLLWPLALPGLVWLYRAWHEPASYQQWKAFSYAQPLLLLWVGCGAVLLARALAARAPAMAGGRGREALEGGLAVALVVIAAAYAFWPRTYFGDGGCCIAGGDQIGQLRDAGEQAPGGVRVSAGYVWTSDVAAAVISARRPVSVDPPSIWPSEAVDPVTGVVTFETGTHPSLVEGRFALQPAPESAGR